MKLTIEQNNLAKSLGHVQSVVERRNTIPILSNVKIEAGDGVVKLNATDMDQDIVEATPAQVSTPGATTDLGSHQIGESGPGHHPVERVPLAGRRDRSCEAQLVHDTGVQCIRVE